MTFRVFSMCLSTRRDRVSSPWSSTKADTGEMTAPVSLRRMALILVVNAACPRAFQKLIPW